MLKLPTHSPLDVLEEIAFNANIPESVEIAARLTPCTRLTSLTIASPSFSVGHLEQILSLTRVTRLTLKLSGSGGLSAEHISVLCARGAHLAHLDVDMPWPLHLRLHELGTGLSALESLQLPQPDHTAQHTVGLMNLIRHLTRLTLLGLRNAPANEDLLDTLTKSLPRLRSLALDCGMETPIPHQGLSRLLAKLPLTSLNLRYRILQAEHIKALASCTTLQILNLHMANCNNASAISPADTHRHTDPRHSSTTNAT